MYTGHWRVVGFLAAVVVWAQSPQPSIQITGAVKQALTLTADDLAKMRALLCTP